MHDDLAGRLRHHLDQVGDDLDPTPMLDVSAVQQAAGASVWSWMATGLSWKLLGAFAVLVVFGGGAASWSGVVNPQMLFEDQNDEPWNFVISPWITADEHVASAANEVLFTARVDVAQDPPDWRIGVLDSYEDGIWKFAGDFGRWSDRTYDGSSADLISADVTIEGLDSIWLPTPGTPVLVETPEGVGAAWHPPTGMLTVDISTRSVEGVIYTITAVGDRGDTIRSEPRLRSLDLPTDPELDAALDRLVDEATSDATEPFAKLEALAEYRRSTYVLDSGAPVELDSGRDPAVRFLTSEGGPSNAFASSFALAARKLGLPSRVVVGYGPGYVVESDEDWVEVEVRENDARVWPEVYLADRGWVSFDPWP